MLDERRNVGGKKFFDFRPRIRYRALAELPHRIASQSGETRRPHFISVTDGDIAQRQTFSRVRIGQGDECDIDVFIDRDDFKFFVTRIGTVFVFKFHVDRFRLFDHVAVRDDIGLAVRCVKYET